MNEEIKNNEMIENNDNFDVVEVDLISDDADFEETQSSLGKNVAIGAGVALATVGIGVLVKKVVVPRIGAAREAITDWKESRKEAKLAKQEAAMAKKGYVKIGSNSDSDSE